MTAGKPIGNMIINLDLNSSKLTRGLTGARNAVNYQMKAMKAQMQVMDASGNKLGVLQAKYTGLGNVLQANQKQIEILTDRYKKSYDENGKATSATIKYANQLNQATARQASYEAQIKQTIGAYAELQTKTTGITGVINKTSDVLQKAGNSAQNIGTSLTHGVTIPIAGAVTAVTTAAVKWESAFAGVKKTNDEIVDSNGNVVYSYSDYVFTPITYTSPESETWGIRIQDPVTDERYTISGNMLERLKNDLQDYPSISGSVTLKWKINPQKGDYVPFIYEPLNINTYIQVVGIKTYPAIPNKPPEITLSNTKKTMTAILANMVKKGVV